MSAVVRGSRCARAAGIAVLGALAVTGLTACEKTPAPASVGPSPGTATSALSPAAPPSPGTAQPSLLINQDRPFSANEVERLRHVSGVSRLALIGYGQVWVYDQQIPTATVDPLTYRPFTPSETRGSAAVWSAVTDGKALVSHTVGVRDHLSLDATVPAGWSSVRIAGLATTVPGVDMVVSSQIGERIGVPYGNGLVVAVSGSTERATARIRRIIGSKPAIRRITKPSAAAPGPSSPAGPLLPVITPPGATPATPGATPGATSVPPTPPTARAIQHG